MPILSRVAQSLKARWFLKRLRRDDRILEIGAGGGWVGAWLRRHGHTGYVGVDIEPPADVVGDILQWRELGFEEGSFDAIVAFEVVEHVDCFQVAWDLLKPGGELLLTTPVPAADPLLEKLEQLGLSQQRTSPHDHLLDVREVDWRGTIEVRRVAGLSQWGRLTKEAAA